MSNVDILFTSWKPINQLTLGDKRVDMQFRLFILAMGIRILGPGVVRSGSFRSSKFEPIYVHIIFGSVPNRALPVRTYNSNPRNYQVYFGSGRFRYLSPKKIINTLIGSENSKNTRRTAKISKRLLKIRPKYPKYT